MTHASDELTFTGLTPEQQQWIRAYVARQISERALLKQPPISDDAGRAHTRNLSCCDVEGVA